MFFPTSILPDGPKLDTKRALILVDFQNDFVSPKGNLYVPNVLTFIPKLPSLVERFREKNEIAWIRTEFSQPRPTFSADTGGYAVVLDQFLDQLRAANEDQNEGPDENPQTGFGIAGTYDGQTNDQPVCDPDAEAFLAPQLPNSFQRCCCSGTWGAQLPTRLADCIDSQRDMQVMKSDYSALSDMNFILQLRTRLVTDLYICGSLSNIGVYATVIDAVRNGFNVTLVEDCLGYRNEACHVESVTQMADTLGADGIDLQELMDDLAGMLGDVVDESDFRTSFQVSMQPRSKSKSGISHSQKVNEWMNSMEQDINESTYTKEDVRIAPNFRGHGVYLGTKPPDNDESSGNISHERKSSNTSPPRKRSTSERDETEDKRLSSSSQHFYTRRASHDTYEPPSRNTAKKSRSRKPAESSVYQRQRSSPPPTSQTNPLGHSRSTGDLPDSPIMENSLTSSPQARPEENKSKKLKKQALTFLGPADHIGDGDSSIIHDVLGKQAAERAFHSLKSNIRWQKMYHRSGEVPRLVAVQGDTFGNGSIVPIYRHPADESPELLPFDETVNELRRACEKVVKHPLNHVLIQYYRSSEDNISEHSDKTLDIVRGSSIVNLSLGAMRNMTLRTKKSNPGSENAGFNNVSPADPSSVAPRTAQRIHLPHDSVFILGQTTNANYLHSIRADKRPTCEKSSEELAFSSERISLTFRHIGTFINTERDMIWGQGARGKTQDEARRILKAGTITANREGEEMIIAFGKENHLSEYKGEKPKRDSSGGGSGTREDGCKCDAGDIDDTQGFNWDLEYGGGFDVVNFVVRPV